MKLYCIIFFFLSSASLFSQNEYFTPLKLPAASYEIQVKILPESGKFHATQKMQFHNTNSQSISVIGLYFRETKKDSLRISLNSQELSKIFPLENGIFNGLSFYKLPEPVKQNETLSLSAIYEHDLKKIGNPDTDFKMSNWNPVFWWDGKKVPSEYNVKISIPDSYQLACSGVYDREKNSFINPRVVTSFGLAFSKHYKKISRQAGDIQIQCFYYDSQQKCAELIADSAISIINFYQKIHGFYPFRFLNILPGYSDPLGGFPFASGMSLIHGMEKKNQKSNEYWEWITAHEIGHQYWGEYIYPDYEGDSYDSWEMIGFGIYLDREYTKHKNLGNDFHLKFINRYLTGVYRGYDTTLDASESLRIQQNYDRNNILIHGKSYSLITALENLIHSKLFSSAYQKMFLKLQGKGVNYRKMVPFFEEAAGQNLDWFFEQWVRTNRFSGYEIKSSKTNTTTNGFETQVIIGTQLSFRNIFSNIPVKAVFEDGEEQILSTHRYLKENILVFHSESPLKSVEIGIGGLSPLVKESVDLSTEDYTYLLNNLSYSDFSDKPLSLYQKRKGHLLKNSQRIKLGLCLFGGKYYQESEDIFQEFHQNVSDEEEIFTANLWLGILSDINKKHKKAIAFYQKAMECENSVKRVFRYDQLGLKIDLNWLKDRLNHQPFTIQ